jgi:MinD-like ATPase involved in chromosome partitioning or flagellar assembly
MIAGSAEYVAFRDYLTVLGDLERAFQFAGEKIEFRLGLLKGKDRYVEIFYNGKPNNIKFIEGDSLAQAIKDVAGAVRL